MLSTWKAARDRFTRSSAIQKINPYVYEALGPGQIRLFQFVRERNDGRQLYGSLQVIDLHEDPETGAPCTTEPYYALSYAWGSKDELFPLICDGAELRIHKNLRDALLRLKDICGSVPFWVDAICINQMDDNEKLVQIRQMPEIYTTAVKVFAWVGEEVAGSECSSAIMSRVIQFDAEVDEQTEALNLEQNTLLMNPITRKALLKTFKSPPPSTRKWSSVIALFTNPWFSRLWVLQLARELIFVQGSQMITWDLLYKFSLALPFMIQPGLYRV